MILKQIPEDFVVEEIFDFSRLKKEGGYSYFILTKVNFSQIKAIEIISNFFGV
ncbi:MAG: tRNA pseudouridine(13) synthase TruD, partial [Aquifex sp.]